VQESEQLQIYLEGEKVAYGRVNAQQLSLNYVPTQLTQAELVRALAAQMRMREIPAKQLELYIDRIIVHLLHSGSTLTGLQRAQFSLVQALLRKIEAVRSASRAQSFQQLLFAQGENKLGASQAFAFHFAAHKYCASQVYAGAWRFDKHFSPRIADLKVSGEEFECAKAIDVHPRVKYWLRNRVGDPQRDFWLQTATDKFYPDFLVELIDGTRVAVEYKGEAYATNDDSREKKLLGERWAAVSGCKFTMVEKLLNGANITQQLNVVFTNSLQPNP
jgi:type III restriction enzyme